MVNTTQGNTCLNAAAAAVALFAGAIDMRPVRAIGTPAAVALRHLPMPGPVPALMSRLFKPLFNVAEHYFPTLDSSHQLLERENKIKTARATVNQKSTADTASKVEKVHFQNSTAAAPASTEKPQVQAVKEATAVTTNGKHPVADAWYDEYKLLLEAWHTKLWRGKSWKNPTWGGKPFTESMCVGHISGILMRFEDLLTRQVFVADKIRIINIYTDIFLDARLHFDVTNCFRVSTTKAVEWLENYAEPLRKNLDPKMTDIINCVDLCLARLREPRKPPTLLELCKHQLKTCDILYDEGDLDDPEIRHGQLQKINSNLQKLKDLLTSDSCTDKIKILNLCYDTALTMVVCFNEPIDDIVKLLDEHFEQGKLSLTDLAKLESFCKGLRPPDLSCFSLILVE